MTALRTYRTTMLDVELLVDDEPVCNDLEMRWVEFRCDALMGCLGTHYYGILGIDLEGDGERWLAVVELEDRGHEEDFEEFIAEADDVVTYGWVLCGAAFGLPWEVMDSDQARRQFELAQMIPPALVTELREHTPAGLLALRRHVGRDLRRMPHMLHMLARYRTNVGGERRAGWSL